MGQKRDPEQLKLEEVLRDRLSVRGEYPDDVVTPEGIRVPRPPMFRKQTPVVGTETARRVEELYKIVPELRGRASIVSPVYTPTMINVLLEQAGAGGDSPEDVFGRIEAKLLLNGQSKSNLRGMTGNKASDVYATDYWGPDRAFGTLAHEFQHVMDAKGRDLEKASTTDYLDYIVDSEKNATKTGDLAAEYAERMRKRKK